MIFFETHQLEGFQAFWHLCYFFPANHTEYFSGLLLEFKEGDHEASQFWLEWVEYDFVNAIYDGIQFGLILRMLGHDELKAITQKPLDLIGQKIAKVKGGMYRADAIGKIRRNKKLSNIKSKKERQEELKDNYYLIDKSLQGFDQNVLIIDDIKTSGTSMLAVRKLLNDSGFTGKIYGFSLGLTERKNLGKNSDIVIPWS